MVGPMVCTVKDKLSVVTLLVCGTMVTLTNDLCDLKCPKDFSRDPFFHSVELKRSTFTAKRSPGLYVEPLSPSNGIFGAMFGVIFGIHRSHFDTVHWSLQDPVTVHWSLRCLPDL